jgi:hypothetical protein
MSQKRWPGLFLAVLALCQAAAPAGVIDTVVMKNGIVYKGDVDKDPPIVQVFDGLRRVVVRETQVAKINEAAESEKLEQFNPVQPMSIQGGSMPVAAINIEASPWDLSGRRSFRYEGASVNAILKKPIVMTQAIYGFNPVTTHIRGVNGFWQGQIPTSQVPKPVILNLLSKLDQSKEDYRRSAVRFLLQAGWYTETKEELRRLEKDFPDLKLTVANVLQTVQDLEARSLLAGIERSRKALQPREVRSRLRRFPTEGVPSFIQVDVRDQLRRDDAQAAADKALADSVRRAGESLTADARKDWKGQLVEISLALTDAPDAVRDRLDAFKSAEAEGKLNGPALLALALSGWVVGTEAAVSDLEQASALWKARKLVAKYLSSNEEDVLQTSLAALRDVHVADKPITLQTLIRMVRLLPPALADGTVEAGKPKLLRVRDDPNPQEPTEYTVLLPPEYHPLRSYPAVIALHSGREGSPAERTLSAAQWWGAEAAKRGYIVIAPEYGLRDKAVEYRYSPAEHAAVELAIRDGLRRFSIDSNRVFIGGVLNGANMAWDFGLGHPDLFAGAAVISGLPAKYVWVHKDNTRRLPFYLAMGDLAPTETSLIFDLGKSLITKKFDVTYVEYYRRGLEDLPEEAVNIFDWMDRRAREPQPKSFSVATGRSCDNRFFGVLVKEFSQGRSMDEQALDPLGRNLKPATLEYIVNPVLNRVEVTANGIRQLDVWVPVGLIDYEKKMEVQVNRRTFFKGMAKPDLEPILDDLRVRGDRKEVYGLKVAVSLIRARP